MPKMKSHRGAAKRFRLTGKGKVRSKRAFLRHCLEHKSKNTKKGLSKAGYLSEPDARKVKAMLGLR